MLLKDPLVHFLALGGLMFAFFLWRDGVPEPDEILISAQRVEELRRSATLLEGRAPTAAELRDIVAPAIREEVYYREALALGLDVDDDEVRRRLVEKMQYLTEDLADPEAASDEELRAFYESSAALFVVPEQVTFDQVFFSPSLRGDALDSDVAAALEALISGANPTQFGDRTPLENRFSDSARERVLVLFGEAMTNALFTAEPNVWLGPFESDFGLHLVRLIEKAAARRPPYEAIVEQVRQVFADTRRREANEAAYAEMLTRYDVTVEWPEENASEASP